ncbi:MAG: 2Fe-2S iron-sulfur cluster-binding protein, partial [Burkholderiales bacterium]
MNKPAHGVDIAPLVQLTFDVNGQACRVAVDPSSRLAEVLRDELGLSGTKIGCDAGDCGACTVLLDGRQVCACLTAAAQADGRAITTVEGLARNGRLDGLQRAFLAHGAAQCGICTPGMLIAASDLLARNARPTEPEVLDALGGVLCRCTGYRKIVEAVLAATEGEIALPEAPAGGAVGFRAPKTDGVAKVTGSEMFGADRAPAGALWLRTIRSPHAKARFTLGDFGPVRAKHPGLVDVITARDVPRNSFGIFPDVKDQPVLAAGRVRFRGEAVLCLVGERREVLRIREDELPIQWTPETPQTELDDALANCADPIHASNPDNVLIRGRVVKGDVDAAIAGAAFVAEAEF